MKRAKASSGRREKRVNLTAIDAELALVSKQEELEIDRAKLLLRYAELQKAMGGTWKWIP